MLIGFNVVVSIEFVCVGPISWMKQYHAITVELRCEFGTDGALFIAWIVIIAALHVRNFFGRRTRSANTFTNGVWSIPGERVRERVHNHTASHERVRERKKTFTEQITFIQLIL